MAKALGRLKRGSEMRESILKRSRRFERGDKLAQTFAKCHAKLIDLLIQGLQRRELLKDDLSKLVLEIVHRLEHFGQILDRHLELPERLKHICELAKTGASVPRYTRSGLAALAVA